MIDIMDSCMIMEEPRKDIIEEYILYQHEYICNQLKEFWNKNYEKIENK